MKMYEICYLCYLFILRNGIPHIQLGMTNGKMTTLVTCD